MSTASELSSVLNTGFTVLFEPSSTQPIVDIVFIHGLQGHPRNTWTWEPEKKPSKNSTPIEGKSKRRGLKSLLLHRNRDGNSYKSIEQEERSAVFWPYHLLGKDCPDSRILTWGYNSMISTFFSGPANKSNIFSYSRDLLQDLSRERRHCHNRPLIFVAHSLGGIIIKQMLLLADESTRESDQTISRFTKAVMFLGTPHQGSPIADTGETMRRIASVAGFDTAKQNLRTLQIDSGLLEECQRRFSLLLKRRSEIEIIIFQEARGIIGFSYLGSNQKVLKVVPDFSSLIQGLESVYSIDANHIDMCRYSDETSDGYRKVSGELQRLCEEIQKAESITKAQPEVLNEVSLDSLTYREMNYRLQEVQNAAENSSTWIFRHESYNNWLREGRGLLWIKGKPGSGKSTMMKKIFKNINHERCVRLAFFFHRRGNMLQQSLIGMFRTMLHQLLSQVPLAGTDFACLWEKKKKWDITPGQDWEWRVEELREVFASTLLAAAKSHRIVAFVDALDEAGDGPSKEVVRYFQDLNKRLSEINATTSICFSCRHFPIFAVKDALEVCVEVENQKDIKAYILAELKRSLCTEASEADSQNPENLLQEHISNRASGVFLWAVLMTPMVVTQYNNGESLDEIFDTLAEVPADLGEVYQHILTKVLDPKKKSRTLRLMQWVYLAEKPLSVTELRFAMASDDSSIQTTQRSSREFEGFVENDEKVERQIISLSGGLAEVKHTRVQFIHQTVNDFLLNDGFTFLDSSSQNPIGNGHRLLSASCLNYIKLNAIHFVAGNYFDEEMIQALPFIVYAITYSFRHAEVAENYGISNQDLLQRFEWPSSKFLNPWNKDLKISGSRTYRSEFKKLATGMTLLHLAAAWNLFSTVTALLERKVDIHETDDKGNNALHYATYYGKEQMAQKLLNEGIEIDAKNEHHETALNSAAELQKASLVKLLIRHGANIHNQSTRSGSSLACAASHGNGTIFSDLLDAGAQIDARSEHFESALKGAAQEGNEEIVCHLLRNGVDVNAQGEGFYNNALQAASARGRERIVQLLLKTEADVNAQGGDYGNALQAASAQGFERIVQLLLENRADVNASGGESGNALQAASFRGHERIVQLLLENRADVNAQGGRFGNALQTASVRGLERIVQLLLENRADVNAQGGYYGNALQAASYCGYEKIVKLLLESGADVHAQGGYYGNALQAASDGGRERIVQLLLKTEADVNAQGGEFGNALQAASYRGHERIVQLLLENRADVNASGGESGNALQAASFRGHERIVQLLLDSGAHVNASGGESGNALQAASRRGHERIVQLLLESGADVNAQGGGKYVNALEVALRNDYDRIAELLLANGAIRLTEE